MIKYIKINIHINKGIINYNYIPNIPKYMFIIFKYI